MAASQKDRGIPGRAYQTVPTSCLYGLNRTLAALVGFFPTRL
jgi:hypothetical protein